MDPQERYLIGELAELAGVTPRTIRYYTAEGLLPPPQTRGKYARYGPAHLRRLRLIGRLKADYLPLSAIRRRLEAMGEAEARQLLEDEGAGPGAAPGGPLLVSPPAGGAGYAQGEGPRMAARESQEPFRLTPAPLQTGRVEFFPSNPDLIGGEEGEAPPARWQRIALAPGVELHVREPVSARRRRIVEDMVAGLRDALLREDEQGL